MSKDKNTKDLNENSFWKKISQFAKDAGVKVVYSVLLLYYAFRRKDTPAWAKRIILGAIGYFIAPIDAMPDLTPFIGYTDDLGVLSMGLVAIAAYVNQEVKDNAKNQLAKWFKTYNAADLEEVDKHL